MGKTAIVIGGGCGRRAGRGGPAAWRRAKASTSSSADGPRPKVEAVADAIRAAGGQATAVVADTTDEASVTAFVEKAEAQGPIDLAIFNAGNNMPGNPLEMEAEYFETCWRIGCFGGFLFSREALRRMVPRGAGTLLLTGASASMRGKPNFAAFTSAKAGLRALGQSLAREFGPQGIHVAHVRGRRRHRPVIGSRPARPTSPHGWAKAGSSVSTGSRSPIASSIASRATRGRRSSIYAPTRSSTEAPPAIDMRA